MKTKITKLFSVFMVIMLILSFVPAISAYAASAVYDEAFEGGSLPRTRRGGHHEHRASVYSHAHGRSGQDHDGAESARRTL